MGLNSVPAGKDLPNDFNVIIEISANSAPVKYEVEKDSEVLFVDRFLSTSMIYPANYGYIPQTLSEDGDPVDVLVVTPFPVIAGAVIRCRVVGVLKMSDESGIDAKLLAVPVDKLTKQYTHIKTYKDLGESFIQALEHFFEHYKDLEKGKWVKVDGWAGIEDAHAEIMAGIDRFQK
jgi:inorganic pyrophosphatase